MFGLLTKSKKAHFCALHDIRKTTRYDGSLHMVLINLAERCLRFLTLTWCSSINHQLTGCFKMSLNSLANWFAQRVKKTKGGYDDVMTVKQTLSVLN